MRIDYAIRSVHLNGTLQKCFYFLRTRHTNIKGPTPWPPTLHSIIILIFQFRLHSILGTQANFRWMKVRLPFGGFLSSITNSFFYASACLPNVFVDMQILQSWSWLKNSLESLIISLTHAPVYGDRWLSRQLDGIPPTPGISSHFFDSKNATEFRNNNKQMNSDVCKYRSLARWQVNQVIICDR